MYYDEQFIRQKKLARIVGEKIIYPEKPNGICLFELDYGDNFIYMDYKEITSYFYDHDWYWTKISEFVYGWLVNFIPKSLSSVTSEYNFYTLETIKKTLVPLYTHSLLGFESKTNDKLKVIHT